MTTWMTSIGQTSRRIRGSRWYMLATCCIAIFSDTYTYGVLASILPFVLSSRARVPKQDVQTWVATLPSLLGAAIVFTAPFAGWFSDYCTSRRPVFVGALVLQAAAVGLFAAGTSLAFWIAGALLAGASSAIVWATCLSLIIDRTEKTQLSQALGHTSLSLSLGILLGPPTGGAIFAACGPFAVWGVVFGLIGLDTILRLTLIVTPEHPDSSEQTPESTGTPSLIQGTLLSSFDGALTIHLRNSFHWQSTEAGLVYIAFVLLSFLCPVVGMFADLYGGKWISAFGFVLSTASFACLRLVDHDTIPRKVLLLALFCLIGLSIGTILPVFSAEVAHVVFEHQEKHPGMLGKRGAIAQAEGTWWAAFSIGATCGPLWGGLVQEAAGWKTLSWTLAVLSGITVFPILAYTGGKFAGTNDTTNPRVEGSTADCDVGRMVLGAEMEVRSVEG